MRSSAKYASAAALYRGIGCLLVVVLAIACSARRLSAAAITIIDSVGASYSASGTNLGSGLIVGAAIYRIDIFASVAGNPSATEAFGAVSFDIELSGAFGRSSLNVSPGSGLLVPKPNYTANNPGIPNIGDSGGNAIPLTFSGGQAGDLGVSNSDLIAITSAIDPSNLGNTFALDTGLPVADPRLNLGKTSPFLLGTVYVNPLPAPGSFRIVNGLYSIADATTHSLSTPQSFTVAPLFIIFPEPSTLCQTIFGAIALLSVYAFRLQRT